MIIKVREKISDKTVNYPASEMVLLIGHVGLEEYYEIDIKDSWMYAAAKANLPIVVVLPTPFTPTTIIT